MTELAVGDKVIAHTKEPQRRHRRIDGPTLAVWVAAVAICAAPWIGAGLLIAAFGLIGPVAFVLVLGLLISAAWLTMERAAR